MGGRFQVHHQQLSNFIDANATSEKEEVRCSQKKFKYINVRSEKKPIKIKY